MAGKKSTVAAKLTMPKNDGSKLIVEVTVDASFHEFYRWYRQVGRKRKVFLRTSSRNDGITPHWRAGFDTPGLDVLAARTMESTKNVTGAKIKVLKKRKYLNLLTCAPDELAGGLPKAAIAAKTVSAPVLVSPVDAERLRARREKGLHVKKGFYFNHRLRELETICPPEREVHVYVDYCEECGFVHSFAHFPDGSSKCRVGYDTMKGNPAFEYIGYLPKKNNFRFRYRLPAPQPSVYETVVEEGAER